MVANTFTGCRAFSFPTYSMTANSLAGWVEMAVEEGSGSAPGVLSRHAAEPMPRIAEHEQRALDFGLLKRFEHTERLYRLDLCILPAMNEEERHGLRIHMAD